MTAAPDVSPFGGEWVGAWITADDVPAGLVRVAFQRRFELSEPPASLPVRVSADSRYVVWLNGVELGRGPSRSQPHRRTADVIDLAPALVAGPNVLVVLVTFYGSDNAHWQRASVARGLGSGPALVVDPPPAWRASIASGPEWTAAPLTAWSAGLEPGGISALPVEVLDQRALPAGWPVVGGVEWPPARRVGPVHPGPRRATPPAHPFGALPVSTLPALGGATVAAEVVAVRRLATPTTASAPVEVVHEALRLTHGAAPAESVVAAPEAPLLLIFDFGRVVSGVVEVDVDVPDGTKLDLAYLERAFDPAADNRYLPHAGARVVVAGSAGFRALETNGMRYLAALVTPPVAAAVGILHVGLRERLSPFEGGAAFSSSDEELERLWHAGVRTVQLNSSDALTDCPTREQRAWVGDGVVHVGVHLVANADWSLVERHLELCDSPRPDGLLPMSVVGDFESRGAFTIPDWSLHWIHGVWLHARSARRAEYTRARLATAERILSWFSRFLVDGALADVPEWTLVDWSSVFTSGRSAILTALWARGLAEFADLAEWLGDAGRAAWARALRAEAELGFEQFWDADRRLYVDHIVDGRRMPAVSQAALASAIVADLVPPERRGELVEAMTDESRLVDRGWNAPSPSVSIEQRIVDRESGVQRIDWDVEREIVRAEPFFSSVVHDAVAAADRADLLPALLRRWSRFLVDGYDTFGECWDWGSPAHGWSSTPTIDLVTHVLGVRPGGFDDPGYIVAPARTGVAMLSARVPTRAGFLAVELDAGALRIDAPLPVRVRTWRGETLELPAGCYDIDLEAGVTIDERRRTT